MEQGPKWRVVGNVTEDIKNTYNEILQDNPNGNDLERFTREDQERIRNAELEKTSLELDAIKFANQETNRLLEEAGIKPYDLPEKNVHIIPHDLYMEINETKESQVGISYVEQQSILIDENEARKSSTGRLAFWNTLFHELLHIKAHVTMQSKSEDGMNSTQSKYRHGVGVHSAIDADPQYEYLNGLHEAIVSELQKEYLEKLLELSEFADYKKWLHSDEAKRMRSAIAQKNNVAEDDIVYFSEKEEEEVETFPYPEFRKVFGYITAEISSQLPEQYPDAESVKKEYLKSHFTGQLLVLARPFEETFGKGSFRILGEMNTEEEAPKTLEKLKELRAAQKAKS